VVRETFVRPTCSVGRNIDEQQLIVSSHLLLGWLFKSQSPYRGLSCSSIGIGRGAASNRWHPFVEALFSDITQSGAVLNLSELVREPLPPTFHRVIEPEGRILERSNDEKACSLD
jgi:hypothetical protein